MSLVQVAPAVVRKEVDADQVHPAAVAWEGTDHQALAAVAAADPSCFALAGRVRPDLVVDDRTCPKDRPDGDMAAILLGLVGCIQDSFHTVEEDIPVAVPSVQVEVARRSQIDYTHLLRLAYCPSRRRSGQQSLFPVSPYPGDLL